MAGMARLTLEGVGPSGQVLLLGAHCDDIEIGCGATLVDLADRWPNLEFHAIIFCSDEQREKETRGSLLALLGEKADVKLHFGDLQDGYLPYEARKAKDYLKGEINGLSPNLVFTHFRGDAHQDHRFVAELTYQVFRDHLILEMEIPKYDGDLGQPNIYIPVGEGAVDRKISVLTDHYHSQSDKYWFTEETFRSMLRLRGLECKSPSGMAEAFYAARVVLS
jgi:LmbE family N-acetylglucosaminyl deacetylase